LALVMISLLAIIFYMHYYSAEQYIPRDKNFEEVMDEYDPDAHTQLKMLRIKKQHIESEMAEIDGRILEIQNTDLGGHSSAYFTAEMNKLATKRAAIKNKLDLAAEEEMAAGESAGKFVRQVNIAENNA
jgi:hypothetical protein